MVRGLKNTDTQGIMPYTRGTMKHWKPLIASMLVATVAAVAYLSVALAADAPRVTAARISAGQRVVKMFADKGISYPPHRLFFRVFKAGGELEVWAQPKEKAAYIHIKTYPVCASSGAPGPKRRQGDAQVPEGFYRLDRFNPYSSYHLSMRVNYPNASDRILGRGGALGGDIYTHGDCVTIGCLPMTDKGIDELYLMALDTHKRGQPVDVHIFPDRMDDAGWARLRDIAGENTKLLAFWKNLRTGYAWFESYKKPPQVSVTRSGLYSFK